MRVERVCAWCGKHLGWVEWRGPPDPPNRITHSICPSCSARLAHDLEQIQTRKEKDE